MSIKDRINSALDHLETTLQELDENNELISIATQRLSEMRVNSNIAVETKHGWLTWSLRQQKLYLQAKAAPAALPLLSCGRDIRRDTVAYLPLLIEAIEKDMRQ